MPSPSSTTQLKQMLTRREARVKRLEEQLTGARDDVDNAEYRIWKSLGKPKG